MNFRTLILGVAICGLAPVSPFSPALPAFAQETPSAKPFLHSLFSDNAVLQRDKVIPVWGWTTPGATVTVQVDAKPSTAKSDSTGLWKVDVGPYPAGGPHTLTVSSGATTVARKDILFGDVWLCTGQSNMEFGMKMLSNAQEEINKANNPNIRLFIVPHAVTISPLKNIDAQWVPCTSANIANGGWGGFSAAGYFFGRKLNETLNVPIGLLESSWGGTEAESWVSASALGTLPDFQEQLAQVAAANANANVPYQKQLSDWMATQDAGGKSDWSKPDADDSKWLDLNAPGHWEASNIAQLRNFDGVAWYRRAVDLPTDWAGQGVTLNLGGIDDADETFVNGVSVGSTQGWGTKRQYKIPGNLVKAGRNVIAVRVLDTGGEGGMGDNAQDMRLDKTGGGSINIAGIWKFHPSVTLKQMGNAPLQVSNDNPHVTSVLYNGMIAPLVPYGVKGAIWYQGENNSARADQYGRLLPVLIKDWRNQFKTDLPFYIVQLAGFMAPDEAPRDDDWPRLRAAQMQTALTVPNTGIAITTDIGDEKDIHPKDKQDVGLRLALDALAKTYKVKVESSGPTLQSVKTAGSKVIIGFDHADGGLSFKGDTSRLFAVAGEDLNWFWATPKIVGNTVELTSPWVSKPVYARYAWSNLPQGTLYNGSNLPAPPFQSIDLPKGK